MGTIELVLLDDGTVGLGISIALLGWALVCHGTTEMALLDDNTNVMHYFMVPLYINQPRNSATHHMEELRRCNATFSLHFIYQATNYASGLIAGLTF